MALRTGFCRFLLKQLRNPLFSDNFQYYYFYSAPLPAMMGVVARESIRAPCIRHSLQPPFHITTSSFSTATAGEANLASFLKEEIEAEKQHARENFEKETLPAFPGFELQKDQAEIKLTRTQDNENVIVTFNVNHAVEPADTSGEAESNVVGEEQENAAPMIARPPFVVEISKGDQKLAFACQIVEAPEISESGETGDLFQIEELYVYEGEVNEKTYASSASVIDGALYDHLMGYLEHRGMDNKFVENLVQLATHYEHSQYVGLLQKIKDFVAK